MQAIYGYCREKIDILQLAAPDRKQPYIIRFKYSENLLKEMIHWELLNTSMPDYFRSQGRAYL